MFHLKYPKKRGFLTWDELGCLARALGFQAHVFVKYVGLREEVDQSVSVSLEDVLRWIEYNYFHKAFHQTFNHHTADWNECVLRNSLKLLDYHVVTFEELLNIRVAYQVHEAGDMKGMLLDTDTLLRAFKMCGRTIAPMKLQHRMKHMQNACEERGRIQLYEFLDLLLWCDLYEDVKVKQEDKQHGKDKYEFYKLDDFKEILTPYDALLANQLNKSFLAEEYDFGKEIISTKRLSKMDAPVKTEIRKEQVKKQKKNYLHLKKVVGQSQKSVYNAKAGYVRPRPISAPDLTMYEAPDRSMVVSSLDIRPQSVYAYLDEIVKGRVKKEVEVYSPPKQECLQYEAQKTVHEEEILQTQHMLESLKFENEVMTLKYQQMVAQELEHMMPGYRERSAARRRKMSEAARLHKPIIQEVKPPKNVLGPSKEEVDHKLAYPGFRGPPPTHAKACDARFRGWFPVNHKKGHHFVVTSDSFENSPQGRLYDKLCRHSQSELGRIQTNCAYRFTKGGEVVLRKGQKVRPRTTPTKKQKLQALIDERKREEEEIMLRSTPIQDESQPSSPHSSIDGSVRSRKESITSKAESESSSVVSWGDLNMYEDRGSSDNVLEETKEAKKDKAAKQRLKVENGGGDANHRHHHHYHKHKEGAKTIIEMGKVGRVSLLEDIIESGDEVSYSMTPTSQELPNMTATVTDAKLTGANQEINGMLDYSYHDTHSLAEDNVSPNTFERRLDEILQQDDIIGAPETNITKYETLKTSLVDKTTTGKTHKCENRKYKNLLRRYDKYMTCDVKQRLKAF